MDQKVREKLFFAHVQMDFSSASFIVRNSTFFNKPTCVLLVVATVLNCISLLSPHLIGSISIIIQFSTLFFGFIF
jgi:hypothetical protein